ncbi:Uncharacterized protein APZ42_029365 [Daphnia magna]|uniref:Uncharacterized protein n=1 Tax=Daphnia magna TaxID=35525 RepID=A0A164PH30_9CRUS|nr:Uncharacterized protein APZ42_029365 [Daphnia magna]
MTSDEVSVASHQLLLPLSVEYTEVEEEPVDSHSSYTSASESMTEDHADDHLCTAAVVIVVDDPVSHVTVVEPPPQIQTVAATALDELFYLISMDGEALFYDSIHSSSSSS